MLFRPVRENDLDDIVRLAARAGVGMTSLPHDVGRLAARIRRQYRDLPGETTAQPAGFPVCAGGHRAGAGGGGERH
ncbi:Arginine N-succinyltransferase [Klebsiella pneumoniae]|uniref:Arginine N-succinyltransferase n=1 Tax=Klebsiella pneumoniae TaxID=573 RepID=A0A377XVR6_KLEPN|nr:Arginine N-succinyltransferase [Klebsiella pneumoniae]